jgi:hypothetical protein
MLTVYQRRLVMDLVDGGFLLNGEEAWELATMEMNETSRIVWP